MDQQIPQLASDRNVPSTSGPICNSLKSIPQIQRLYVNVKLDSVSVLAIVPKKDFAVEHAIYERQLEIIDALPGFKFNLRVISLRGRELGDVVTPIGTLVFHR